MACGAQLNGTQDNLEENLTSFKSRKFSGAKDTTAGNMAGN
jgi:hypothetical protein